MRNNFPYSRQEIVKEDIKKVCKVLKSDLITQGPQVIEFEKKVAKFAFASVVSTKFIRKGQKLNINNIWVKRPGTGHFAAKDYHKLLGKISKKKYSN